MRQSQLVTFYQLSYRRYVRDLAYLTLGDPKRTSTPRPDRRWDSHMQLRNLFFTTLSFEEARGTYEIEAQKQLPC